MKKNFAVSLLLATIFSFQYAHAQQNDSSKQKPIPAFSFDSYPIKIKFDNDSICITNKNERLTVRTSKDLANYLNANIKNINKDSVLLDASPRANSDRIKSVLAVFSNYKIIPHKVLMFE